MSSISLRAASHPVLNGAAMLGREGEPLDGGAGGLLVGTMRMGYGHYRMGRAAVTWGLRAGARVFVHDPLAIPSFEAAALRAGERVYCAGSRFCAACGGPVERAWGRLMKTGGWQSQAASRVLAHGLKRLMGGVPRDWPIVCAFPWNAHLAVVCGFKRVINLIPDSCPQHFLIVPDAINLTQNEESRQALVALGVSPDRAAAAGHWIPAELAENAAADSEARLDRLRQGAPLRLLFSVGGAGAQTAYLEDLLGRLAPQARAGRLRILFNAGDHVGIARRFERFLRAAGLAVARRPFDGAPADEEAAVFFSGGPLEAVVATDRLMRVSDVLVTKPSELAFFPLPKLHIRRVGDHEAPSARYSAELGDGTPERREPADAAADVERWLKDPADLARLNEGVRDAAGRGVYLGAKTAVELALHGRFS